ncbi:unnamed protein product [Rotaria sp. Silwood1]|nr:unnamed protein product [Rotaria sp. Silwood1]CAF3599738.1 unnamed protein product [Rotaria sp. Silwood1]CAF3727138.1 unnamed protein product [Rotaria sp. Silwood1]CAF4719527.1 unnamed protein product [Rotaria sp. Silwood1]CAF4799264.1 unnamed protein product [Rotaria sp. Silwood1]
MVTVNYWAVATCTMMNMVLGMLWYSPLLFGTTWCRLMKLDYNKMKNDPIIQKNAQKGYMISSICHLVMAIMMAHFIEYTHASGSWFDGLKIGFCCWLGFTLTTMLPNQIFSKDNFSWILAAINIAYPMVGLSTAGAILAAWH